MKRHLEEKLKMKLQLFAEEAKTKEVTAEPEKVKEQTAEKETEPEKKYTDEDVDKIINKKFAELEEKKQREIDEAKKLAKMNQSDKEKYEIEKMKKRLEEFEKKDAFYGLSKEATSMLSEHDIKADDETLAFVVKDDAEATKQAVDSFVALIDTKVQEGVKAALAGKSPKVNSNKQQAKNPFAKETFNLTEQGKLLKENPELYKQLKAQANK